MRKRRKIIITIIIIALLGLTFVLIKGKNGSVEVRRVDVTSGPITKTVSAAGEVKSKYQADLALPTIGVIDYISVSKGDKVVAGQILANVYNYDTKQTAKAYKDARDVALHDLNIYVESYATNVNAVGGQDEYNINVRRLEELLSKAEASYQSTLGSLDKTVIKTPINATVIDITKNEGEVIGAGSTLVKVADLANLIFEVNVDQEDFGQVLLGQKTEIVLDSYEDEIFLGKVTDLPKHVDETTDEFVVEIEINQSTQPPILLGMSGDAHIVINQANGDSSSIPFDALFDDEDGFYVWVEDNGSIKRMGVEIGLEGDVYTQINSDILDLNIVVSNSDTKLIEGMKVKIKE